VSAAAEVETRRLFVMRCIMPDCNAELPCPEGTDEWGWLRSEPVQKFKAEHVAHGSDRTVGAEVRDVPVQPGENQ
jgi:hypothetical protein